LQEPVLTAWSGLFHRCGLTVVADSSGRFTESRSWDRLLLLPETMMSLAADVLVFAFAWFTIRLLRGDAPPMTSRKDAGLELHLAYLYPYPLDMARAGGAHSHVKGFVSGVASAAATCEVFSGRSLSVQAFPLHVIPARRRWFLFRESLLLSYNFNFVLAVIKLLRDRSVGALYQRHGRFVAAGALLSFWLDVPFVLEYNGSETWMANHWTPARFKSWLRLCEEISLSRAHLIVVVSEALRQELVQRGIPEAKLLLNPNAVDPEIFHPGCGGPEARARLGMAPGDIVVAFVGTFDRWHGTAVLGQAIKQLLEHHGKDPVAAKLRFLLIGDGPLCADMRSVLGGYVGDRVFFTGLLPHTEVPAFLDAADIVVSPHISMPDGRPFFGSPTKLFEYMAMQKAIIASRLDQLSCVLQHGSSAWLVEPGNVSELASAVLLLANNSRLRAELGQNARSSALAEHTWQQNAGRVLAYIRPVTSHRMAAPAGV